MQSSRPFAHATSMMTAIASIMSSAVLSMPEKQAAVGGMAPYRSRGKGKGIAAKRRNSHTRFYVPHGGGDREVARRQSQIARGGLSPIHFS